MRLFLSAICPLLIMLPIGCAWLPESSKRAELMPVPALRETLASLQKESPVTDAWPTLNWWQVFQIPQLDALVETAVTDSPDLKIVAARLRQAQTLVDAQAAALYPTIDAKVSFTAERFSANSTQAKLAGENFRQILFNPLVLRYHLDLWGQDEAALQAAIGRAYAVETELSDARLLLSVAVVKAYFDLTTASEQLKTAEHLVAAREHQLKLAQVRLDNGLIDRAPVLNARVAVNDARQKMATLTAAITVQKNVLAVLAGKGSDWAQKIVMERGLLPQQMTLPKALPLHLLRHRPDVQAARLRVEAAAQEIKVAKTAFYPDVNLVAFSGLHSVSVSDVLLQGSSLAYAVGPSVEFPIFEGGRLRAQLGYREAAYDEAVELYNQHLLRAIAEVADAVAHWQELDIRLQQQQMTLASALENRRLAKVLYREGLRDRSDLLQADADEDTQRLRLIALESAFLKAATQLFKALGGGYVNTMIE